MRGECLPHPGAPPRRARFGVGEFPDAPELVQAIAALAVSLQLSPA